MDEMCDLDRRRMVGAMAAIGGALVATTGLGAALPGRRPIRLRRGRIFVPAVIAGRPVEALLDSGAEATVLDRAFAIGAGVASGGSVALKGSGAVPLQAAFARGVPLSVAGIDIGRVDAVIAELSDVARRLVGAPLPAIIGREFFDAGRYEIDLTGGWLRPLGPAETPRGVRLPLVAEHGIETIPVTIEGRAARATFDLGNGTGPMIGARLAGVLLADGRATGTIRAGGLGGVVERRTLTISTLEVAGRRFGPMPAAIEESASASDANIGTSILSAFRIVTDFPGRAVWLAPR